MKLLFPFLFCLISLIGFGQQTNEFFKITGIVKDADSHMPLQFITISLQNSDNQEIIGDVTNKDGTFELMVPKNSYYCIVGSLSFKSFAINKLKINQNIDLGIIELHQNIEELEEIKLTTKTKLLDYKLGKKVYNASKDISNVGGNAITVLENTPTVRIDGQGNISIRGNQVKVLVNGKSYGGSNSNADILSLIPANSINKVEIINQSAKYDAVGGGGIINIILKKRINEGYDGSIEAHGGSPDNDGLSAFINYKTDKINFFSTASINHNVVNKNTKITQTFLDEDQNKIGNFDENRDDYRQRNSVLFNIGSDFYIDKKNTITTSLLISNTNKNYDSRLFLNDYKPINNLVQNSFRDVDDNSDEDYIEAYINYSKKFNKKGEELSININYSNNGSNSNTLIFDHRLFPNIETSNQKYNKDESISNYFLKADYTLPLKNKAKLEVGLKSNFRLYKNDYVTSNFDEIVNKFEIIPDFTNIINYDENAYGYYINYAKELKHFNYSVGLRTEITLIKIDEVKSINEFTNDYTDFFPTIELNYNFENGNYLTAYYTKFIDRPSVSQLNPFNSFTDERFVQFGNPFLNPSYSNYFLLEYYLDKNKISLDAALFYNNTTDNILNIIEKTNLQTSDGFDIFKRYPINNGNLNQTGLDLILTYFPTKRLRLNASVTPFYAKLINTNDKLYDYTDFRWYGRFSLNYKISNTLKFKIDYTYQSPLKTAITSFDKYQYTNVTASKDFFSNKATLSFRVQDIFNGRKGIYNSLEANTISKRTTTFETRYLLSFTYRFNKTSKRNSHNRAKDVDRNVFEIKDKFK